MTTRKTIINILVRNNSLKQNPSRLRRRRRRRKRRRRKRKMIMLMLIIL
jgi:hypothetical protein